MAFATCDDGRELTFILDRRTNKDHSQGNLPYIFIYLDRELRKIFLGSTLNLNWDWSPSPILPVRLPGIMASLFADRSLKAPQTLRVEAADEQDSLSLVLNFDSLTELIVPDNQQQQYTFIEEVTGTVEVNFSIGGETIKAKGLVYGEYVV